MKKLSRAAVTVAMIVSIPTAACTWRGGSAVDGARASDESIRGEVYTTSLPTNVDQSLQRQVQTAETRN